MGATRKSCVPGGAGGRKVHGEQLTTTLCVESLGDMIPTIHIRRSHWKGSAGGCRCYIHFVCPVTPEGPACSAIFVSTSRIMINRVLRSYRVDCDICLPRTSYLDHDSFSGAGGDRGCGTRADSANRHDTAFPSYIVPFLSSFRTVTDSRELRSCPDPSTSITGVRHSGPCTPR
ncbi:hypothetical protein BD310DRAFT_919358 [Dichomitus squalens]|uniref:Uncharacterized protein n=1 Tax=Dichomitus squalens TaxID=114155 RepID=A0A4Q9Q5V2_9APHY|nr:hypothetical protein BD310DRAFT_919358 [Dichomitus squalens]